MPPDQTLPIAKAASLLGTTAEALRMRMRRGKIRGFKGGDGRLYVVVDGALAPSAQSEDSSDADRTEPDRAGPRLTAVLESEIGDLRRRLDESERAQGELRRLLLMAQQSIADLATRVGQLPPPAAEAAAPAPPPAQDADRTPAPAPPPMPDPAESVAEPEPPARPVPLPAPARPQILPWPWSLWSWPQVR